MTKLLYLTDSYLREFDARITKVQDNSIALDQTAFYPGGGGQLPDRGRMVYGADLFDVLEVYRSGDGILHRLNRTPPQVGSVVKCSLDWELRYAYMRHHTALHVLSGVVHHLYHSQITGGQVYSDKARLDFDLEDLSPERVRTIEGKANDVVGEAHPVLIKFLSRDEALAKPDLVRTKTGLILVQSLQEVRVVEIEGFDMQTDGGTHVSNTREIGRIVVSKTESKGRHNKRIEIILQSFPIP